MNGMAVQDACQKLKARLVRFACETMNVTEADVEFLPNRVRVAAQEIAFDDFIKRAYLGRVSLSATGFYATPKIHWDRQAAKGRPFYYFA
jgi:xanthine dehydrogenase large subunit